MGKISAGLLALLLCSSAVPASEAISSGIVLDPAASARLTLSRDRDAPNACDIELSIDEQLLVSLPVGESVTVDVPSGELTLVLRPARAAYCGQLNQLSSQSLLLQPGENRRYQVKFSSDSLFLAPEEALQPADPERTHP